MELLALSIGGYQKQYDLDYCRRRETAYRRTFSGTKLGDDFSLVLKLEPLGCSPSFMGTNAETDEINQIVFLNMRLHNVLGVMFLNMRLHNVLGVMYLNMRLYNVFGVMYPSPSSSC